MTSSLLEEIIYQIIVTVNGSQREQENHWLEAETESDYAEANITVTRYFDSVCTDEIKSADVVITNLIIWDDENNNIATEADYQQVVKALEKTGWIDAAYEFEQPENERLFAMIAEAVTPYNQAV